MPALRQTVYPSTHSILDGLCVAVCSFCVFTGPSLPLFHPLPIHRDTEHQRNGSLSCPVAVIAVKAFIIILVIPVALAQSAYSRQLQSEGTSADSRAAHARRLLQPGGQLGTVVGRLSPSLLQASVDLPAPSPSPSPRPGRSDQVVDLSGVVLIDSCANPGDLIKGPAVLEEAKFIEQELKYANYNHRIKLNLPALVSDRELAKKAGDMVSTCNASAVDGFVVGSMAGVSSLGKVFDIWSQDKSEFYFALRSNDYRRVGCAGNMAGCCRGREYICFLSTSCYPIGGRLATAAAAACVTGVAVLSATQP